MNMKGKIFSPHKKIQGGGKVAVNLFPSTLQSTSKNEFCEVSSLCHENKRHTLQTISFTHKNDLNVCNNTTQEKYS
jgi:hypothetical protein